MEQEMVPGTAPPQQRGITCRDPVLALLQGREAQNVVQKTHRCVKMTFKANSNSNITNQFVSYQTWEPLPSIYMFIFI